MKKKKKINITAILIVILLLLSFYLIHTIYLFNGIENKIRYIIITFFIIIDIICIINLFEKKKHKIKKKRLLTNISLLVVIFLYIVVYTNLNEIYSFFKNLNKDITYTTSLVTLTTNNITDTKLIENYKIGLIEDNNIDAINSVLDEGNLRNRNEIITYTNYPELITALYENNVSYIFLPGNYIDTYKDTEEFKDISEKVKKVTESKDFTKEKEEIKLSGTGKDIKEPFTMLLIGIDSTTDGFKNADSFNGDSLILLTFNPNTLNLTMLTIPRDTYVPISCFPNKEENKITHAAAKGTSCVIETIENFLNIKIDYYAKINFTGMVDLVDALGGIEVNVPYNICEQNSKREFGSKMIYIRKGYQKLNGEEALAFARNRKKNEEYCSKEWTSTYRDDFSRQENQQAVIKAILEKAKEIKDLESLKKVMNAISKNIDINMNENTIFSFYNLGKDIMLSTSNSDILNIIKLYIDGQGQIIYDEKTKLKLWNYIPHNESVEEVIKAMKENLGEINEDIKDFTYEYNEEYNPKPIGKGPYKTYFIYDLLPDITSMTLQEAEKWAVKYNVKLNIKYITKKGYKDGTIISQDYPVKKRIDKIEDRKVTIEVVKNSNEVSANNEKIDCLKNENSICNLPNFVSEDKSSITNWASKFSNTINIFYKYEKSDEEEGTVIKQDVKEGTTVKELINKSITITFTIAKK